MKNEVGRILLGNVTLIEYDCGDGTRSFFVQCGVAGFYANEQEWRDLAGVINYYLNIESIEDIVVSIKEF